MPGLLSEAPDSRFFRRYRALLWTAGGAISIALLMLVALGVVARSSGDDTAERRPPDGTVATFVGSEACAGCHTSEAELWRASQHKHAMDHATEKTVLGDFDDATFDYDGVRSRFFRKDGKFQVETDGPDGKPTIFDIKYTFGVDPLQHLRHQVHVRR